MMNVRILSHFSPFRVGACETSLSRLGDDGAWEGRKELEILVKSLWNLVCSQLSLSFYQRLTPACSLA